MSRPTRLSDLTGIATPADAPAALRFSASLTGVFEQLRRASYPGGRAKEQGGTIVADKTGELSLQNIGGYISDANSFYPNLTLRNPDAFKVVGVFHTHPYDRTAGSFTGVSFSGGDFAHLSNYRYTLAVMQSGPRLFAMVRTALTPKWIPWDRDRSHNVEVFDRVDAGKTLPQASRVVVQQAAGRFGIAYYQGGNGVVTRV